MLRKIALIWCAALLGLLLAAPVHAAPLLAGWTQLHPVTAPSARASAAMAYDARTNRTILYGGITWNLTGMQGETWAYDGAMNQWTLRSPPTAPPGQFAASMVYDERANRIILFGGGGYGSGWMAETWAYDSANDTWTNLKPSSEPPGRNTFGMVYESRADRILIFGGYAGGAAEPFLNDTWAYDYGTNTWSDITPATSPSGRTGLTLAYDAASDVTILYGGDGWYGDTTDTWAFDLPSDTWRQLHPAGTPFAVRNSAMVYDDRADRAILVGGRCLGSNGTMGTWTYDYARDNWTLVRLGLLPPCLVQAAAAYDSGSDTVWMFGGSAVGVEGIYNGTWAFRLSNPGPADLGALVLVAVGSCAAGAGWIAVVWFARRDSLRSR